MTRKLNVSLPEEDVEFLDAYAELKGLPSRSAVLHEAVRLLRGMELASDYKHAFNEWKDSGDALFGNPLLQTACDPQSLEPFMKSETNHRRTALTFSNDGANTTTARLGRGIVTVVPVTSNVDRVHPFQVFLPADLSGLRVDSKAQAEQISRCSADSLGNQ